MAPPDGQDQTGVPAVLPVVAPDAGAAAGAPPPASAQQVQAIRSCIESTLVSYKRKRRRNKIGAIAVHAVTIGLASLTTVLVGWKVAEGAADRAVALTNVALLTSALATAASSLEAVFDYRALWVGYNVSISRLKAILARLQYLESVGVEQLTRKQVDDLYTQYETICSSMEKDYKDIRMADDE